MDTQGTIAMIGAPRLVFGGYCKITLWLALVYLHAVTTDNDKSPLLAIFRCEIIKGLSLVFAISSLHFIAVMNVTLGAIYCYFLVCFISIAYYLFYVYENICFNIYLQPNYRNNIG